MAIRALIVDDEAQMRGLLALTLGRAGVEHILQAANGQEAVSLFSNEDVNLVFLDLNMPKEDGFSVLKKFKEHNADAYVIIVSAESSVEILRKALSLGAKGFVVKPYQASKINDAVQRYLSTV